jgi:hypothetical protein
MPTSDLPLIIQKRLTTTSEAYKDLVRFDPDPDEIVFIEMMTIIFDSTADNPHMEISSNGEMLVRDYIPSDGFYYLAFNQKLRFVDKRDKPALLVRVRSDGTHTVDVEITVTGIRRKRKKDEGEPTEKLS